MKVKRAVMMGVLFAAIAAVALPVIGLRARAASNSADFKAKARLTAAALPQQPAASSEAQLDQAATPAGSYSPETLKALGIRLLPEGVHSRQVGKLNAARIARTNPGAELRDTLPPATGPGRSAPIVPPDQRKGGAAGPPLAGQPNVLNELGALSAALITTIGGRDTQFSEVALLADWDGREDCVADRSTKVDDFSTVEPDIDFTLTKAAISEVTFANGHLLNLYYYGDSIGNVYVAADLVGSSLADVVFDANLPDLVNLGTSNGFVLQNPVAGDCADDQMTVTGIAVNPVADLGDFDPALCGILGEVIYVSAHDSQGCAGNAGNQPIRTRIFAFATFNIGGTVFIVTNVRQILRNAIGNVAGVAVDEDGSLYFHLSDLVQFSGGAIFKATEQPRTVCETAGRINRVIPVIPNGLVPTQTGTFGLTTNTPITSGGVRLTNYTSAPVSGATALTPEFGNITAITTGPCNVLYAAVAASFVAGDVSFVQLTQGLFTNRAAVSPATNGATPSMIITFADCAGAFDVCSGIATGGVTTNVGGGIPIADGFADGPNLATPRQAGINNFRVFVTGNGPEIIPGRPGGPVASSIAAVGTLDVDGFQVDFTLHSGIAVNEEGTVFVISGGTPAGIGKNPSPMFTEILCFEDMCPMDRRADFTDLRGTQVPNPPASGGNIGDGLDTRFDHIFHQAPIDQVTLTPTGLSGLARGFLRYTNRLAPVPIGPGVLLGSSAVGGQTVQDDNDTDGTIIFEFLDPSHQTAGGDDSNVPNRGDDDDGLGTPPLGGFRDGGFEFLFGGPVGTAGCVWNGFFLNSNGNITFGVGSTDATPTVPELRSGPPRIAPAWTDLNPASREDDGFFNTFPLQALGFANINAFKVRWINVPEAGFEECGSSNTFGVTLYDDGTGIDENSNKVLDPADPTGDNVDPAFDLQEGPTDLRFVREPNTGTLVGCPPRPEGSGHFIFEYCRMDLLGTADRPVIAGFSIGGTSPLNPPGLCEINLSTAAAAADLAPFGVIQGVTASLMPCLIGEGTEPHLFELFNEGSDAGIGSGGEITFATPDFDLRFEGNDAALCTPARQRDLNRGKVGFFGVGCAPPANPICATVVIPAFATAPNQGTDLIDALCAVQVSLVGCGFFPNEATIICQGFQSDTGVPIQRPGKNVSTAVTLACDTNGDGIIDATIALGSVTPVNKNLVRATFNPLAAFPGTAFPTACCGGAATLTVTTTFTAGDNNVFGPFTRTVVCPINLGVRAPVVFSVTPSDGNCAVPIQNLIVTGACFCLPNGAPGVTSAFAVERGNPSNVIGAIAVKPLSCFLVDVEISFTSANAGRTFLIFLVGPGGTSRNLTSLPAGAPAGCPLGNEQGIQVTFTCNTTTTTPCVPGTPGCPACVPGDPRPECQTIEIAVIRNCNLNRSDSGVFTLTVTGENIKEGAAVTVGGTSPRKVKFKDSTGTDSSGRRIFSRVILKGRLCGVLPNSIVITNPGARASAPFLCNARCPSN